MSARRKALRVVSVFAGIEGFGQGFEQASNQFELVTQIEINKHRIKVLEQHYPNTPRRQDVTTVAGSELPEHEVLAGGFPCQGTSGGAPHRLGLADPRSRNFWEFMRLVEECQPQWFVIENPPGFMRGRVGQQDFTAAIHHMAKLGYGVAYRVVDAAGVGSSQRRLRILFVGHRGGDPGPAERVLADTHGGSTDLGVDHQGGGTGARLSVARSPEQARWYRKSRNPQNSHTDFATYVTGPGQEYANTLTCSDSGYGIRQKHLVMHGEAVRVLVPTEWERLQGFPDGWTAALSDNQRWNALGDAMNVHMARWLGRRLIAVHNSMA